MANPKRKTSKSRTGKRRSQYYNSLTTPNMMECENCGTMKQYHRACANCGHYRGREVVEREEVL